MILSTKIALTVVSILAWIRLVMACNDLETLYQPFWVWLGVVAGVHAFALTLLFLL